MILLVNKDHIFNESMLKNYEMVEYENCLEETIYVERETLRHFEMLFAHLKVEGIIISIKNAYRSLETQENIFLDFMKRYGIDYTEQIIEMPGYSEHHTGQALDIIIYKDGKWLTQKEELLQETEIFKRIHNSLKYFGFILRYPENKKNITGVTYKPWHIRFIGEEDALKIEDLSLEEYLS